MRHKTFRLLPSLILLAGTVLCAGLGTAGDPSALTGREAPNFTLSSNQNRLVSYGEEYYGRHNLIITFFPAAFTPV